MVNSHKPPEDLKPSLHAEHLHNEHDEFASLSPAMQDPFENRQPAFETLASIAGDV
jgi:hypothetical protein